MVQGITGEYMVQGDHPSLDTLDGTGRPLVDRWYRAIPLLPSLFSCDATKITHCSMQPKCS